MNPIKTMKHISFLLFLCFSFFLSCNNEDDGSSDSAQVELKFDNVAIVDNVMNQLELEGVGSTNFNYSNGLDQDFNVTLLRYFITDIVLEGPDGAVYEDKMEVSANDSKGYYIIDESDIESQTIILTDVPSGEYSKISFTVGVDEAGVLEGAAGGALDPATNKMFWNWNAGYIAVKFEGQSDVSAGGANGETIFPENEQGLIYHIGGWKKVEGTPFVYNNKRLTYPFFINLKVDPTRNPRVVMTFDVMSMLDGDHKVDFTGNNNVHKPSDGSGIANNLEKAFAFDHLHN